MIFSFRLVQGPPRCSRTVSLRIIMFCLVAVVIFDGGVVARSRAVSLLVIITVYYVWIQCVVIAHVAFFCALFWEGHVTLFGA